MRPPAQIYNYFGPKKGRALRAVCLGQRPRVLTPLPAVRDRCVGDDGGDNDDNDVNDDDDNVEYDNGEPFKVSSDSLDSESVFCKSMISSLLFPTLSLIPVILRSRTVRSGRQSGVVIRRL